MSPVVKIVALFIVAALLVLGAARSCAATFTQRLIGVDAAYVGTDALTYQNGSVWWSNFLGEMWQIDPVSGNVTATINLTMAGSGSARPTIVSDTIDGFIWIPNDQFGSNQIAKLNQNGTLTAVITTPSYPLFIWYDSNTGDLWRNSGLSNNLYKVNKTTGADSVTLAIGIADETGVTFDAAGNAWVVNGSTTMRKITPAGVITLHTVTTPLGNAPIKATYDAARNTVWLQTKGVGNSAELVEWDIATLAITQSLTLANLSTASVQPLVLNAATGRPWILDTHNETMTAYTPSPLAVYATGGTDPLTDNLYGQMGVSTDGQCGYAINAGNVEQAVREFCLAVSVASQPRIFVVNQPTVSHK